MKTGRHNKQEILMFGFPSVHSHMGQYLVKCARNMGLLYVTMGFLVYSPFEEFHQQTDIE